VTLPPRARSALLLDLDGTLIDLAPTPDGVTVPPTLAPSLRLLAARLDGALAIISGRPVEIVDRLLDHAAPAVAGEHGAAIRSRPGATPHRGALPVPPASWLRTAEALVADWPGAILERKARGFTMHFRQCPDAGPVFHALLRGLLTGQDEFALLGGSMVWEIRPAGVHKGHAVVALMAHPPFLGRVPVFIGDDITDEDAIHAAEAMGGAGLRVAPAFGSPGAVRAWIAAAAEPGSDAWPPLPGSRS
jgi:trehalose 6-phosphate phosphatase